MTHRISFLTYSEWDSDRECVAFMGLVDWKRVCCLIAADALDELSQEKSGTPLLMFNQSREVVEELAKTLIQSERLDGHELVIRVSDVLKHRNPPPTVSEVSPPECIRSVSDGRLMSMTRTAREEVWQSLCDRQRVAYRNASPAIGARAQQEFDAFEKLGVPETAHELNLRRVAATRLGTQWKAPVAAPL